MLIIKICLALMVVFSAVFAEATPQVVKDFTAWISDVEYDSTNDCYVVRYRPTAKSYASVYEGRSRESQKIQPGESYVLALGKEVTLTQHAHAWCRVTFTNGVSNLNGVALPAEFKNAGRQLLIQGSYAVDREVFKTYLFIVNAEGAAYDVSSSTKFHFGLPFHAPGVKTNSKLDRSMENIQRLFFKEGIQFYKAAQDNPTVRAMKDVVKEGMTNAVAATVQVGGAYIINEGARTRLLELDSKYAQLLRKVEESKMQYACVVFCTRENNDVRIVAVARVADGPKCRMWWYEDISGNPSLIYSRDCQKSTGNYYEYGNGGTLRSLCLSKNEVNTSHYAIKDGVLQKSSDMEKAQAFISKVGEMFARYVEFDTTGALKAFVEKRGSKPVPGR